MAKKVKRLLELSECCRALNMTEDEVLYLVRTRAIPHRVEDDGRLTFTEREILGRVIPKPPQEAMGKPKFDISAMSKDDVMELFSKVLQGYAAEEEKELKKTAPAKTVPPEVKEKKEEVPTAEPEAETKKDMEIPEEQEKKEEVPTAEPEAEIPVVKEEAEKTAEPEKEPEKEAKKETKPKKETAAKPNK